MKTIYTKTWYVKRMCHLLMAVVLTAGLMIAAGALNTQEVHAALTGDGTPEHPYMISSYADLKEFSRTVNESGLEAYAELENDIECDGIADWEPIGSSDSSFDGRFDGKGFVIKGLSNEERRGAAESDYQGLFGYIADDGKVKNVGLEGGKIIGNSKVGALAGINYGTIDNCYNTGTISGSGTIGGLAGINYGTIENCYNTGAISGKAVIGGIAGENHKTITYCWNTGEVSGKALVGGVAGSHSEETISSCFNTGKVIAVEGETVGENGKYAGGITGSVSMSAKIIDCYNTGAVSAVDVFGGVVGESFGEIKYCYYDEAYSAITSYAGYDVGNVSNAEGLQTSKMTGMDAIYKQGSENGMKFEKPDCWLVTANGIDTASGEYYEYYPHLKGFAYDIDPVVKNWPAKPHVHMQGGKKTYFLPWERTDQLPDTAGSYYLTGDVSLDSAWNPPGTVSLCLNDHSIANISTNKGRVISIITKNIGLNLFDCGDTTRYYYLDSNGKGHVVAPDDDNYANAGEGQRGTFKGGFITGGKPASDGGGVDLYESGTSFTMNGGTIIGNNALGISSPTNSGRGGGVYVNNGGEFTMNGGNIIGNTAKYFGGGVFSKGKFTMNGGNITGNTAGGHGGGIYLGEELETFSLSGDPMIIGNKVGENGFAEDIHLEAGQTITITDELKLPDGATTPKIGIDMGSTGVFTSGYSIKNPNKAPSVYFMSNDDDYVIAYDKDKKEAQFISNTVTAPTITAQPADLQLDYGYKTENKLTVAATAAEDHTLSYQWYTCSDQGTDKKAIDASKEPTAATAEYTLPSGIGAGSHYYFCRVTAANAGGKTSSVDSSVATLTVNKAKLTLRVYDQEYEYDGDPHGEGDPAYDDPAVIANKIEAVGLQNSDQITSLVLDGSERDTGIYENRIEITGFSINGNADAKNNYNITLVAGKLTIKKIKVDITTAPTASAITYGQSLADSTLTGGQAKAKDAELAGTFVWVYDDIEPAVSDSNKTEYEVRFLPTDVLIYQTQDTKIKLTVNKAHITPSVSIQGWTYGSEANKPVVSGNTGSGTETFWYKEKNAPDSTYTKDVPVDAGQYTVKAEIAETANYNGGSATLDFTISPADMQVVSSGFSGDFDGEAHSISVEAPEGASIYYSWDGGQTYTSQNPTYTDVGEHVVPFDVRLKNHNNYTGSESVIICQAPNSVTVSARGWTYGEQPQLPEVKAKFGADKAVLSYSDAPDGTYQQGGPDQAGTWYVKATVPETKDYAGAESNPAVLVIKRAKIQITADDKKSLCGKDTAGLSYTVSGAYVEGDDLGIILSTDADQHKPGTYPIRIRWNQNPNYEAVLINGEYRVTGISDEEKEDARIAMNAGLKGTSSKGTVTAAWGKAKGADKYVIYANYCGVKRKCKKIKTVSGKTTKINIRKLAGKKLNKKRSVKYYVVSYKTVDGKSEKLAKSLTVHVVGSANENASNIKSIKVKKSKYTLKRGKKAKIKARLVLYKKGKKPLGHASEFRYDTSNKKVATVSESGKIKAVGKGKCKIYVYAQNGCAKKIKVTVK